VGDLVLRVLGELLSLSFLLLFLGLLLFVSSSCASCGLGFKIQTLCFCVVNVLIKGEIEKPSDQKFGLIVMSN
jgi:hypothetical protein